MGSGDDVGCKVKASSTCDWSLDAVFFLLDRYGEKFRRGNGLLRNKDWEELVACVNTHSGMHTAPKTLKQCRDKIDSLKKRYKMERKRVLGTGVTASSWPFFAKLNEIIESVPKIMRVQDGPCKQPRGGSTGGLSGYVRAPFKDEDVHNSSEEEAAVAPSSTGDLPSENASGESAQEDDLEDSSEEVSLSPNEEARVPSDTGGCKQKLERLSESMFKLLAERRRRLSSHPVQALADAIVGFSDVYARIELAKLEIYTNLQLEMANIGGGRKRKRRTAPSSLSDSDLG